MTHIYTKQCSTVSIITCTMFSQHLPTPSFHTKFAYLLSLHTMSTSTIGNVATSSTAAACITVTPDKNGYVPIYDCRDIWFYYPSFGAAILFSILFGMTTVLHFFQAFHFRKRFCWVIIMGGTWETAGFILRIPSTRHQLSLRLYIPEELFILLAPLWINAFVYMTLGRMIHFFLPEQQVFGIKATRLSTYFICADIVAFLIQAVGGTIATGPPGESCIDGIARNSHLHGRYRSARIVHPHLSHTRDFFSSSYAELRKARRFH